MSIAEQVSRIRGEKSRLGIKLSNMGLASQTDKLEKMVDAVEGIVDRGAVDATVMQGESYTIPAGYHNGSGTVRALDNPEEDASKYLLQSKTVTPTKAQQSVTSDQGYYGLSSVTVERIPDAYQDVSQVTATEADVLSPKTIVKPDGSIGVGTIPNNGAKQLFLGLADDKGNWISRQAISKGYHDGNGFAYIVTEDKEATPSEVAQTIKPTAGSVLKSVVVNPIPLKYKDNTNTTAYARAVLKGLMFWDNENDFVEGEMPNNGSVSTNIDLTFKDSVTLDAGYYSSIKVGITDDLENELASI